VRNDTILYMLL